MVAMMAALFMGLTLLVTVSHADEIYTVKSGDTLSEIAYNLNNGTSYQKLATTNKIKNVNLIYVGQKLLLKSDGEVKVATKSEVKSTPAVKSVTPKTNTSSTNKQSSNTTSTNTQSSNTTKSTSTSTSTSYTGSNLKSYVLSQMESRTGVSSATWNMIITRESNWEPSVRNSTSGAYGLFQNMHISGGSVEQQVNAAVSLYNAQGMAAWAL
ncbi:LysM peptidoglycan-binding domain-containing protein [Pediococcus inopinatus]|uniref:LysM peptidoglycan-binding domain-containing protein n=2 Tax=Pediococcus inopinatus TaxID=114090 RepID=A0ABZ0Q794_9LACO|nr:LysM peptidoglycan-binding domain-containing protein [Pediococcus inopinatus]WPC18404.1 LysM peptidoglycan-binding domain-containing protein [Pediococcus inopinatus]WPC20554.1 LysM peptidoglycan-binding domain-containing protein [Pediococcus inopinatus]WPC22589.1 LysM peptidoglycan-binding domain-containing protein [Pediococcus inopinatus]WPP10228.1 LysM peptidoglycan-binding domain-containing protein [Pediococcus inopinatus]